MASLRTNPPWSCVLRRVLITIAVYLKTHGSSPKADKSFFRTTVCATAPFLKMKRVAAHKQFHHHTIRALAPQSSRHHIATSHPFHQMPSGGCSTKRGRRKRQWLKAGTDGRKDTGTVREKNLQLSSNQGVCEVSITTITCTNHHQGAGGKFLCSLHLGRG